MILVSLLTSPARAGGWTDGWGGSIGVTSNYIVRGLTQSDDRAALIGDVHYRVSDGALDGVFGGLSAGSVRSGYAEKLSPEITGYLGYVRRFGDDWSGRIIYSHYAWPGTAPRRDYDYDDFVATAGWRDRIFTSIEWSPDSFAFAGDHGSSGRSARSAEIAVHQPLLKGFSANAGAGYRDLGALIDSGYAYFNAGFGYQLGHAQLDLSYLGSFDTPAGLYSNGYAAHHWTATLLWNF